MVPKFVDDDGRPMAGATGRHGLVSAEFIAAIRAHVVPRRLGPVFDGQTGVLLRRDPDVMRGPDVTYASWDRFPDDRVPDGRLDAPLDLVVEVLSPNDRASEVQRKVRDYLNAGMRLVWVADADNRIVTAYTPDGAARIHGETDTLDGGDVLPELRIPVGPLFAFERPTK